MARPGSPVRKLGAASPSRLGTPAKGNFPLPQPSPQLSMRILRAPSPPFDNSYNSLSRPSSPSLRARLLEGSPSLTAPNHAAFSAPPPRMQEGGTLSAVPSFPFVCDGSGQRLDRGREIRDAASPLRQSQGPFSFEFPSPSHPLPHEYPSHASSGFSADPPSLLFSSRSQAGYFARPQAECSPYPQVRHLHLPQAGYSSHPHAGCSPCVACPLPLGYRLIHSQCGCLTRASPPPPPPPPPSISPHPNYYQPIPAGYTYSASSSYNPYSSPHVSPCSVDYPLNASDGRRFERDGSRRRDWHGLEDHNSGVRRQLPAQASSTSYSSSNVAFLHPPSYDTFTPSRRPQPIPAGSLVPVNVPSDELRCRLPPPQFQEPPYINIFACDQSIIQLSSSPRRRQ